MQDLQSISGSGAGAGRFFPGNSSRHHRDPNLKCPRCDSSNTKFCYYNNYNLSQPRHFCKSCRRYWTKGGVLRNVPIGGGCRKSKRSSSSSSKTPKSTRVSSKPKDPSSTSDTSSSLTSVPDPVVSVALTEVGIIPETSNSYVFPDLAGFGDEIVPVDLAPMFGNPTAGLDWHHGCPDPVNGFFDPITADPGMFWAQNHWPEPDPYLLP